jgi:hypothetical protein
MAQLVMVGWSAIIALHKNVIYRNRMKFTGSVAGVEKCFATFRGIIEVERE